MINAPLDFSQAPTDSICIHGARQHNLKNLSLRIPHGRFVVITGVSGSGKSSLAFDLLFAEGQRRFLDCMSAYARQFVEQLARPDVDLITGLPPTVSIEQRNTRGGGKSTVATVTEVYHFLRLLFARLGTVYCPDCQQPVQSQSRDQVVDTVRRQLQKQAKLLVLAPLIRNRKGYHTDVGLWAAKHGYEQIRADGSLLSSAEPLRLDRFREHNVEVVVAQLNRRGGDPRGVVEKALGLGKGALYLLAGEEDPLVCSTERACTSCGQSFEALDPKFFSYNSAQGWCPTCRGFGELFYLPEVERGARADAIEESWFGWQEGKREPCPDCKGARLNKLARSVRLELDGVGGSYNLDFFARMSVRKAKDFFSDLTLQGRQAEIARDILPEIRDRLKFLDAVGLDYLELGRSVTTLSGGEGQRIRLAAQLGSSLRGVLYILDEPTIGLHPRDNLRLLDALESLRERGNSLVVVEHDEETMRRADFVVDLGPGAGIHGGEVIAAGTLDELMKHESSITGRCLRERKSFPGRGQRRPVGGKNQAWLKLKGARLNNLQNISVRFPLERFVLVTGVSGSGKSTLIRECLKAAVGARLNPKTELSPAGAGVVEGTEHLKFMYEVDQSPIGRTPRSIPATYVGFFDLIRQVFAQTPEARMRGYTASRFSFNSNQGRCPVCEGAGLTKLEMAFLPTAYVTCESCGGKRYGLETLEIEYKGKNIHQVLELQVGEALEFFTAFPRIRTPLKALCDTGLEYLRLGQTSPTLSGGEAQRIKLVTHLLGGLKEQGDLLEKNPKHNLFLLEEPTIGLHMCDVTRLVKVLQRLVDAGHSVVVIEHNLDFIAEADWIIDLGPEGGAKGGGVVASGTPEDVAAYSRSITGRFLSKVLKSNPKSP